MWVLRFGKGATFTIAPLMGGTRTVLPQCNNAERDTRTPEFVPGTQLHNCPATF